MNNIKRKPIQCADIFHPVENTGRNSQVTDRLRVDKETKRAIVRCVLGLGKSLRYTQQATRINGRVIPQDTILNVVLEHIQDQQQAEMERLRMEAFRKVQSYRRSYVEELRRTA